MLLCGNKTSLVSCSYYTNFYGYDKEGYINLVFECSNCKTIKFSTISNNRFVLQFGKSTTTTISYANVSANASYSLEGCKYFGLRLNFPRYNHDGGASGGFGAITIE